MRKKRKMKMTTKMTMSLKVGSKKEILEYNKIDKLITASDEEDIKENSSSKEITSPKVNNVIMKMNATKVILNVKGESGAVVKDTGILFL
jgi:hypothetical protein